MALKNSFQPVVPGTIDAQSGIIKNCSVLTIGEAMGHGLIVDATSLLQVQALAQKFPNGVKTSIDHGGSVERVVGALHNFRIIDQQLLADLHLLKTHPGFAKMLELAQTMPQAFGLSVAFSGKPDGSKLRCTELYSVDLVDTPAANPRGLFTALTTKPLHGLARAQSAIARELATREAKEKTVQLRASTTLAPKLFGLAKVQAATKAQLTRDGYIYSKEQI